MPFVTLIALFFYKNIQSYINITHGEPEVSILKDLNNIVLKIIQLFVVNISTFNKVKNKNKKMEKLRGTFEDFLETILIKRKMSITILLKSF